MENLRGFLVKYHGPTDYNGSRISIYDMRHGTKVFFSYRYDISGVDNMAREYLQEKGIPVEFKTWNEKTGEYFLLSQNFTTSIKGGEI